jgi:hypothetical protein
MKELINAIPKTSNEITDWEKISDIKLTGVITNIKKLH